MKQYENLKHGTEDFPVGIHDTVCPGGFSLYPHVHHEFEFLVMKKGKGVLYIEDEKYELGEGDGVFINSEKLHIGIKTDQEASEFFAVVFAPEIFSGSGVYEKFAMPVLDGRVVFETRLTGEMLEILKSLHGEGENELKTRARIFLVWELLWAGAHSADIQSAPKNYDDIKKSMEYMKENYAEMITLDDIARVANMSRGHLCRKFVRLVHMTPFEYLLEVRIDKSCDKLKNTNMTVGEIAQSSGFNSFSYFSKTFRERIGCTPGQYRNK